MTLAQIADMKNTRKMTSTHIVQIAGKKSKVMMIGLDNQGGATKMFSTGMLVAAGATIGIALADKALEDTGFFWIGTVLKLIVPLAGMALGVYFLEHNPILGWLK